MPKHQKFIFSVFLILGALLFSSKKIFAAMSLTFSGAPASVEEEEPFEVDILLAGAPINKTYFLRAAFHEADKTQYFGYTYNQVGNWHNVSSEYTQFLQITTSPEGSWSGKLKAKADISCSSFKGAGEYQFKIGRYTEGGSLSWSDNSTTIIINMPPPTPTLVPSPTPTPTLSQSTASPTPIPATATYKINEVKNENGSVLSSVKIYLDGTYIHHYAPEILTFCDDCKCDTDVDCDFGEHSFRLERTGYQNWSEIRTIDTSGYYEVNPIMETIEPAPTPSTSPRTSPTPSPTPKTTPAEATESGEILGTQLSSQSGFYPLELINEEGIEKFAAPSVKKSRILPKVILSLGLVALLGIIFFLWYNYLR